MDEDWQADLERWLAPYLEAQGLCSRRSTRGSEDPPMMAYVYAADRKVERAEAHLGDFVGILQVDGFGGYAALAKRRQQVCLAFC